MQSIYGADGRQLGHSVSGRERNLNLISSGAGGWVAGPSGIGVGRSSIVKPPQVSMTWLLAERTHPLTV